MNAIEVNNLTKNYGATEVLKGIQLTIQKGEIFGFVGHNGSGKSTFIHILTGISNKTSGSFEILGVPDRKLNQVKKRIGVMPDVANLYHHMRGINFLKYMGSLVKDQRSERKYEILLHELGLQGAERRKIKTYSFGMKKKISIAQALLGDPELIILDEPTSGLDPESTIEIRKVIKRLQEQGKTVFLTSHNLDEIDKISDRVGILSDGIIKKLGTPRELKSATKEGIRISVRTKPVLTVDKIQELNTKFKINVTFVEINKKVTRLNITSDDEISRLSKALFQSDFSLYEIKIDENSLEDVFMNSRSIKNNA
ncbi:ABC transporter ATP-binding protein [Cerasibacillus sp. JNUCC 74]|jgi:ABC-2 type transport system ATP-binding protein|uniref:ABC transporter ATP-binding protein n=1 Tax=Virgibacillus proomii TaxID=84407 RepID=UPI0009868EBA|nr:ABC transporter ATP-binding protein [Virgibacillus proomii]